MHEYMNRVYREALSVIYFRLFHCDKSLKFFITQIKNVLFSILGI